MPLYPAASEGGDHWHEAEVTGECVGNCSCRICVDISRICVDISRAVIISVMERKKHRQFAFCISFIFTFLFSWIQNWSILPTEDYLYRGLRQGKNTRIIVLCLVAGSMTAAMMEFCIYILNGIDRRSQPETVHFTWWSVIPLYLYICMKNVELGIPFEHEG